MIIAISLFAIVALLYSSVYYRQETKRLNDEVCNLTKQRDFAQKDRDNVEAGFFAALNKIDELENKYVFTDELITEIDGTLLQDNTDPTRAEYWDEPCESDALASGYSYDDDGNLVAPQSLDDFVSDVSQAIDSIKWTSQDGE